MKQKSHIIIFRKNHICKTLFTDNKLKISIENTIWY